MNKEHFTMLLEDLYDLYNHTRKSEVPNIVEKYNGREFDAIQNIYFKYNFKSHPNYNSKAGSDSFVKNLIEQYSNGIRGVVPEIKQETPEETSIKKLHEEAKEINKQLINVSEETKKDLIKFTSEKMNFLEDVIKQKEKQISDMLLKMDESIKLRISEIPESIKLEDSSQTDEMVELSFNLNSTETDIKFPKGVENLAVGSRFLLSGPNDKPIAFEIKDIFLDYVTTPGKCLKEISIDRV